VCVGEGVDNVQVLDLLTSLADKNLVVADEQDGVTRYRLLENGSRLCERTVCVRDDQEAPWRNRHLTYFVAMAEEAEREIALGDQRAGLDRTGAEHDNLRRALTWACSADANASLGLRMAAALWRFWSFPRILLRRAQPAGGTTGFALGSEREGGPRARALNGAGLLASHQGGLRCVATVSRRESLAIQRDRGDRPGIAASLCNLGNVCVELGDYRAARLFYEQSLAIYRDLGDRRGNRELAEQPGSLLTRTWVTSLLHAPFMKRAWHSGASCVTGGARRLRSQIWPRFARNNGDLAAARELYGSEYGDFTRSWVTHAPLLVAGDKIALVMCGSGRLPGRARRGSRKAWQTFLKLGDRPGTADSLHGLA